MFQEKRSPYLHTGSGLLFAGDLIFVAVAVIGAVCMRILHESRVFIFIEIHLADIALPVLIVGVVGTCVTFVHLRYPFYIAQRLTKYSSYQTRKV